MYPKRRLSLALFLSPFLLASMAPHAPAAEMLHNMVLTLARGQDPADGPYRFRCPVFGRCNHRIVGLFQTRRRGISETWVVAAIPNESDCHACTSRMTMEVYRKRGGRWRKHRAWRNFTEWGNWGIVRPSEVRMGRIDNRRMILFLEGGTTQMGETTEALEVFIIDGEDITPVRRFCIHYDNEGAITPEMPMKHEKWSARYELVTINGRPALVFHLRDETTGNTGTMVYEIVGRRLRLRHGGDVRLENSC